jgi:hypothetical protein
MDLRATQLARIERALTAKRTELEILEHDLTLREVA